MRQTVITDYYKPISMGLVARFDMFINKTLKKILINKPIAVDSKKQSLMTDYFSTIVSPTEYKKHLITDYFSPSRAPRDFPNGK